MSAAEIRREIARLRGELMDIWVARSFKPEEAIRLQNEIQRLVHQLRRLEGRNG